MDSTMVSLNDLQGDQRLLAEIIGIDNYIKMVDTFGGTTFYIWKMDSIQQNNRNREITDKFNGYNFRELAKEYNLAERTIRDIVSDVLKSKKAAPLKNQIKFDGL